MGLFNSIRLGSSGAGDYEVERSLKFNDDDTAYLNWTPSSAGDRKKWTFSAWIKRGTLGGTAGEQRIFGGNANASHIYFPSNDEITWDLANEASGSASGNLNTTQVFRDPSAWFHLVCALDTDESTADNRMRMYINGSEVTDFGSRSNPTSGYSTNAMNNNTLHTLGHRTSGQGSAGMEFDGYMAEIHFIDGQQYNASYFAETDAITGEYKPKKYAGSYGTNGFYLNFSDNSGTTATTLGKDSSGNGNNWTPNNFSVAAGVGNDSVEDTPTNNWCTLNPLAKSNGTLSNGNLKFEPSGNSATAWSTFAVNTGKWYWEVIKNSGDMALFLSQDPRFNGFQPYDTTTGLEAIMYHPSYHQFRYNNNITSFPSGFGEDDNGTVYGFLLDFDNSTFKIRRNNDTSTEASFTMPTALTAGPLHIGYSVISTWPSGSFDYRFGQNGFNYTIPTGHKALNSANLPDPSIAEGDKHFNTLVFTGNQSTNARTGLGFQPDFVVYKALNPESGHGETKFHDSVRGSTKGQGIVQYNTTDPPAEVTNSSYLTSFDSDGLTVGSDGVYNNYQTYNQTGRNYQALCWKGGGAASSNGNGSITSSVSFNASAGFSIVSWTSTGVTGSTIGHGLGVKPSCIILKGRNTSSTQPFRVYHSELGATKSLLLNTNDSESAQTGVWNDTEPTSSVFTVGSFDSVNENTKNYIAYCFSEVAGYSKFGSFTGNANNNGTFVFCGFKPAFLLIKRSSSGDSTPWIGYNNVRNPINQVNNQMVWNTTQWENIDCDNCNLDFLSNGFKLRNSDGSFNGSGATHIFLAFAESPFKYSRAR